MAFTIREASLAKSDPNLLVDLMDSQIAWLCSIGSSGQWGSDPVRESRPDILSRPLKWIQQSEEKHGWGPQWCRAFVAEVPNSVEVNATTPLAAGAIVLEPVSASYVRDVLPEQDESDPFVYVSFIMSNRNAAQASKGTGAVLLEMAKEGAREVGVSRICLDCYRGNERRLVR